MNPRGLYTLFYKEVLRFSKVWLQTVAAPLITTLLYLLVFSQALSQHVNVYGHIDYTTFLLPGLIMMSIIQNAFANSSSSIIQSKITGNMFFILVPPLSYLEFYLAFLLAAMLRALVIGAGIYLVGQAFTSLTVAHPLIVVLFAVLSSAALASVGILAGMWADKFDQLGGVQNFLIMPLSFLSGVFYSIHSLPDFWQSASKLNPFFYMIDGFRYGFFDLADIDPYLSFYVLIITVALLSTCCLYLLRRGYKLRT